MPSFKGVDAIQQAMDNKVTITGCTVHLVDEGVDTGPILAQRKTPVFPEDDESSLQERVKKIEHILYPEVIDLLCSGVFHSKSVA